MTDRERLEVKFKSLTIPDLKTFLQRLGKPVSGVKASLIERLLNTYAIDPNNSIWTEEISPVKRQGVPLEPAQAPKKPRLDEPRPQFKNEELPSFLVKHQIETKFGDPFFTLTEDEPLFTSGTDPRRTTIYVKASFQIPQTQLEKIAASNLTVHVRCFMVDPKSNSRQLHRWPHRTNININGYSLTIPYPAEENALCLPIEISEYLQLSNDLNFCAYEITPHVIVIQITKPRTVQNLFDIASKKQIPFKDAKAQVLETFKQHDSEIKATCIKVTSLDPTTRAPIDIPVRATTCTHIQCFDLMSYLTQNEALHLRRCTCPYCGTPINFDQLFVCSYFKSIFSTLDPAVHHDVTIQPNGEWTLDQENHETIELSDDEIMPDAGGQQPGRFGFLGDDSERSDDDPCSISSDDEKPSNPARRRDPPPKSKFPRKTKEPLQIESSSSEEPERKPIPRPKAVFTGRRTAKPKGRQSVIIPSKSSSSSCYEEEETPSSSDDSEPVAKDDDVNDQEIKDLADNDPRPKQKNAKTKKKKFNRMSLNHYRAMLLLQQAAAQRPIPKEVAKPGSQSTSVPSYDSVYSFTPSSTTKTSPQTSPIVKTNMMLSLPSDNLIIILKTAIKTSDTSTALKSISALIQNGLQAAVPSDITSDLLELLRSKAMAAEMEAVKTGIKTGNREGLISCGIP